MKILGFPIQIRPGFLVFLLLIVFLNGVPLGTWLAGSVAVFTIAHELGHAVAARRTGATARISLDFLAGYASFTPSRVLTRAERAGIALAGPATQILLGLAALLVLGVNPIDHRDFAANEYSLAIWWAGPIIGVFNLIPVMPLDGGNIAAEAVDLFRPGRGRAIMIRLSVPVTAGIFVGMLVVEDLRPLSSFAAILLVIQMQLLSVQSRPRTSRNPLIAARAAAAAEEEAWFTGRPGLLPPGHSLSPWWEAHRALETGNADSARRIVLDDLTDSSGRPRTWAPPHAATPDLLDPLIDLLPTPLPAPLRDHPELSQNTLVWALKRAGRYSHGASYGSDCFRVHPSTNLAVLIAGCLSLEGHDEAAAQWITVAAHGATRDDADETLLLSALLNDSEFQGLRERPEIRALIQRLVRAE
ncbi:MAG: hypothetical protein B7C54_07030 [Acidimicrobiales bacterium mtb01]|nr:hypothetical protein [Actinomycetota bacterium]TEX44894.1 MAG: hypothetical protein B7C54_07030 [Acidimicrobiales bacterium mtb01]